MRIRVAIPTLAVICTCTISACGGSSPSPASSSSSSSSSASTSSGNGVATKSPSEILAAATGAANGLHAMHVSGSVVSGGSPITMDLDLLSGQGARGRVSQSGMSFQLVSAGNSIYINAGPAFWRHIGGSAAARLLQGKWLKAPANSANFASLAALTNLHQLLTALLSNHGRLIKGATSTVDGQQVVALTDSSNHGTLYVATTGKPYPVQLAKSGSDGGRLTFDRFNESVSLTPPANVVDISKLQSP